MAINRPFDKPKWATGGINILPDGQAPLAEGAGYVALQKPPFQDWNTIWHRNSNWVTYFDENSVQIKDLAGSTNTNRYAFLGLSYAINNGFLTSPATTGGVYWIDGTRVELGQAKLQKIGELTHSFNPNQDTYISITGDDETPMTFQEVPNGNPPPAPPVGFTQIVKVVTDAVEVTAVEQLLPSTISTMYPFYFEVLCAGEKCEFQPVTNVNDTAGTFRTTGTGDTLYVQSDGDGIAINAFSFGKDTTIRARTVGTNAHAGEFVGTVGASAVWVTGIEGGIECTTASGTAIDALSNDTDVGEQTILAESKGDAAAVRSLAVDGPAVEGTTTGTGYAAKFTQSGVGGAVEIGATDGTALNLSSGTGLSLNAVGTNGCANFFATNGTAISSNSFGAGSISISAVGRFIGVKGEAQDDNEGVGLFGETSVNAFSNSYGVRGIAHSNAPGGRFDSEDGHGITIMTSNANRAALNIGTQATKPSSPGVGDLSVRPTGEYDIYDGTDHRQVWATPSGMLVAFDSNGGALVAGPPETLVEKTINLAADEAAVIYVTSSFRLNAGVETNVGVNLYRDGILMLSSILRPLDASPNSNPDAAYTQTDVVYGPLTKISLEGDVVEAGSTVLYQAQLLVLGVYKASDIE